MKSKFSYYWLFLSIPALFLIWYVISKQEHQPTYFLPYYGPKNYNKTQHDTGYHTIPYFKFVNQYGEEVSSETIKGKTYVCEYFFTTCKSICPIMNSNLDCVYKLFKNNTDLLLLSHTVDPETDSVAVLKAYSDLHQVDDRKWLFLTGPKTHLYELARKGYLLNADEGNGGEEDFIHTQNFALIDNEKHIRGFYDGTDSIEVSHLIKDIKLLFEEYEFKKSTTP